MILRRFLIWVLMLKSAITWSQVDSLELHIQGYGAFGSQGYPPHWIVANRYGIFDDASNSLVLVPGFSMPMSFGKKFGIQLGLEAALLSDISDSFIYQGYLNLTYGKLKIISGVLHYTIGQYSDRLSVGSFLVSNNARSYPRVGIGFYEYTDLPFTKGYVQIMGALNHGWLEKDRFEHSNISESYIHEKYFYIRSNKLPVNPHFGIAHFALYGGYRRNGTLVPYDFWSVFFARGSGVSNQKGEAANAYGEHTGIFDWGLNFRIKKYNFQLYHQKPINDSGGYHKWFKYNKDNYLGVMMDTEFPFVRKVLFEYVSTYQQGGKGTPDPVVDGKIVFPFLEEDRIWLEQYYTDRGYDVTGFDAIDWYDFLEDEVNYGYRFGGRFDYYNNNGYRNIYRNRIIGTSLFHTKPQMLQHAGTEIPGEYVVNNRIRAYNLGLEGEILPNLSYWAKITLTRNYGAWQEYEGRYKWEGIAIDPDFDWYYKGVRSQWYSIFEIDYRVPKVEGLSLQAALSYDFGQIMQNFGGMIGIRYSRAVHFKKQGDK